MKSSSTNTVSAVLAQRSDMTAPQRRARLAVPTSRAEQEDLSAAAAAGRPRWRPLALFLQQQRQQAEEEEEAEAVKEEVGTTAEVEEGVGGGEEEEEAGRLPLLRGEGRAGDWWW